MRKLGLDRLHDIEMMTLSEFHYKKYAQEYKEVDEMYKLHFSAFLNFQIQSTEESGSGKNAKQVPVYKNFKEFFDYEKALNQIDERFVENKESEKPINKQLSPAQLAAARNKK